MLAKAPPETEPLRHPRPSDQGQPRFAWERFSAIAKELPPLFEQHWREIAVNQENVPLCPHWDRYFDLDLAGVLRVLTVRSGDALVGYHFVFVFPHLHYFSTMWGESDLFWLAPAFRSGWTGYKLLRIVRDTLKENGVKVHRINSKVHFDLGPILERLGYKPSDVMYLQHLG